MGVHLAFFHKLVFFTRSIEPYNGWISAHGANELLIGQSGGKM